MDVYEVDHPASQSWKRQRVKELGLTIPDRLHYVPIDFERETLTEGLRAGGVDLEAAMFFSMAGVTRISGALRLSGHAAGNRGDGRALGIVSLFFSSSFRPRNSTSSESSLVITLADSAAAAGEPWLSYFKPDEMEAHLRQVGFGEIYHFGPEQAHERYLAGRTDGLRVPAYFHMINAVVEGATKD